MEVSKKKEREEQGQECKKPEIDPAIIERANEGLPATGRSDRCWRNHGATEQAAL
jgi:hypothetical protein